MEPTNELLDDSSNYMSGVSTPERQRFVVPIENYSRVDYNGSPLPPIIQSEDEQHSLVGVADYSFKIIHPGNRLTKKKINITNPVGRLITKSWANIQNEYMFDINFIIISIEIAKDGDYELSELVIKIKNAEEIRLIFDTADEARDCQLYLHNIIKNFQNKE